MLLQTCRQLRRGLATATASGKGPKRTMTEAEKIEKNKELFRKAMAAHQQKTSQEPSTGAAAQQLSKSTDRQPFKGTAKQPFKGTQGEPKRKSARPSQARPSAKSAGPSSSSSSPSSSSPSSPAPPASATTAPDADHSPALPADAEQQQQQQQQQPAASSSSSQTPSPAGLDFARLVAEARDELESEEMRKRRTEKLQQVLGDVTVFENTHPLVVVNTTADFALLESEAEWQVGQLLGFQGGAKGYIMAAEGGKEIRGWGVTEKSPRVKHWALLLSGRVRKHEEALPLGLPVCIPAGPDIGGRVLDALGNPLDRKPPPPPQEILPTLHYGKLGVAERSAAKAAIGTGVTLLDWFYPLLQGRRLLLSGERLSGKGEVAQEIICTIKEHNLVSDAPDQFHIIYSMNGKGKHHHANLVDFLTKSGALPFSTVFSAPADTSKAMQFFCICLYSSCAGCIVLVHLAFLCIWLYSSCASGCIVLVHLAFLCIWLYSSCASGCIVLVHLAVSCASGCIVLVHLAVQFLCICLYSSCASGCIVLVHLAVQFLCIWLYSSFLVHLAVQFLCIWLSSSCASGCLVLVHLAFLCIWLYSSCASGCLVLVHLAVSCASGCTVLVHLAVQFLCIWLYSSCASGCTVLFLAPLAASATASWLRQQGKHVVVVYDDLAHWASNYQSLVSLPGLRRAPLPSVANMLGNLLARHGTARAAGSSTAICLAECWEEDGGSNEDALELLRGLCDSEFRTDTKLASKQIWPAWDVKQLHKNPAQPALISPLIADIASPVIAQLRRSSQAREAAKNAAATGLEYEELDEQVLEYADKFQEMVTGHKKQQTGLLFREQLVDMLVAARHLGHVPQGQVTAYLEQLHQFLHKEQPNLVQQLAEVEAGHRLEAPLRQELDQAITVFDETVWLRRLSLQT
eukprot:g40594.t1